MLASAIHREGIILLEDIRLAAAETAPEPRISRKMRRFTPVTGSMSQSQGGTVLVGLCIRNNSIETCEPDEMIFCQIAREGFEGIVELF